MTYPGRGWLPTSISWALTLARSLPGQATPSLLPLSFQPLREEPPAEDVEAHSFDVGVIAERTNQRDVDADVEHGGVTAR
jgi:hypothetical protein